MQQLSLPFDYKEPLKKEFTPEDMIYISEIKEGNFRHLHCLSCSQDTLFQTLYWDKEIDIHLRSSFRRQYRQTLYNEGRFSVLQNVLRVGPKRIEKLRKRYVKFQIAKKKQEEMEEETKIQERTTQLSAEAQLQRKKRLAFHKVKIRYSIAQEYIFEHIYGCKGYGKESLGNFKKSKKICDDKHMYEYLCTNIDNIAHQVLFFDFSLEHITKILEKVSDTIGRRKDENDDLQPEDISIILLGLPETGDLKMLILEKILAIIATFPITSIEHRKKISTYNDKIRETLKTSFETEDKEKLQKLGLEKFWKYNNQYWQAFGGKHFNDPLPNGEIEYLMDNVKKQKKLLRTFIDCLVVAYANELAENHISEELQKMRSKVLEYFPEYSFYYNTLTREHSKEIAAMRDKII